MGFYNNTKIEKSVSDDFKIQKIESQIDSDENTFSKEILSGFHGMKETGNELPPVVIKSVKSEIQMEGIDPHEMNSDSEINFGKKLYSDYMNSNMENSNNPQEQHSSSTNLIDRIKTQSGVYCKQYLLIIRV